MTKLRAWVFVAIGAVALGAACGEDRRPPGRGAASFGETCGDNFDCAEGYCAASQCTVACTSDCTCPATTRCAAVSGSLSVCVAGPSTCVEAGVVCAPRELACDDSRDDDCDGATDCDDIDCSGNPLCGPTCTPTAESSDVACSNGVDEDCDGMFDCADPDCRPTSRCLGDFVDEDCASISGNRVHPYALSHESAWVVADVEVELTSTGLRTVMRMPGTSGGTIALTSTAMAPREADLQAPPNEYFATCTDCLVLSASGRTYFQRRGQIAYTSVPTSVGAPLAGKFWAYFDEVRLVGGEYAIVPGGSCIQEAWTFRGVAVSGGVSGSGAGSVVLSEGGMGQRTLPVVSCGDGWCDPGENPTNCDADCPCGPSSFTQSCPGGHLCPRLADCASRGRCSCGRSPLMVTGGTFRTALACDTVSECSGAECVDSGWGCVFLGGP